MSISRKRKTLEPCQGCFMNKNLCFCDQIPVLNYATRVSLVVHYKELKRSTNTGRLGVKALSNSEMFIRGEMGKEPLDLRTALLDGYENCLFYPSEDAITLDSAYVASVSKKINLIVPDGSWRQASKVHTRHPEIAHIPRVVISDKNPETEFIRREHTENGMATLQAIACAMKVIEGEAAGEELMKVYKLKLQATLEGRGLAGKDLAIDLWD